MKLLQSLGYFGVSIRNNGNRKRALKTGSGLIAHHGLQRSGTNYLLRALKELGFHPLNELNPKRNFPSHKHFRWQSDKSTIPDGSEFHNDLMVKTLCSLNIAAGYPQETRHFVIQKPPEEWLPSILNWGLRCGWWPSKHEALENANAMLADYQAYHGFWSSIQQESPHRVAIVDSAKLRTDPRKLICYVEKTGLTVKEATSESFDGVFSTVAHSPTWRQDFLSEEDRTLLAKSAREFFQ